MRLTFDERKEKALEILSMLGAFDISYEDAKNIMASGYREIVAMGERGYRANAENLSEFMIAMRREQN